MSKEEPHSHVDQVDTHVQDVNEIHGRAIQQQEHNRSYWQALCHDPKLMFWISLMLWMLIIRGFESQASGTLLSIPRFKERFGEPMDGSYYISTKWQSAINGGPQAAGIFGSWAASYFSDIFGFKIILLCAAVINIVSIGIEFGSTSIAMFFGGKMMNFVAIGAFVNLCTAYVAEISPLAIRSSVIGFCNLSQCIGPFIAAIMANFTSDWTSDWSWKSLVCAQWGFAVVGFIGQIFMPESPVYLVKVNKHEAARKSLYRLYSLVSDADGHLEKIKITLQEAEAVDSSGTYLDCFRGTNLRRTLISFLVFLAQPMAGLGFVSNYGPLMYQYMGVSDQQSFLIQIGAQILSISGAITSFLVADFVGRRPMLFSGCIGLGLLLLCMAISGSFADHHPAAATASVGFLTMYNFFFNAGVGSVVYTIAGEIPTSVLRTKTLALTLSLEAAVNTMWSFVSPYLINPGYGDLRARVGYIFGSFMVVWALLVWLYVPESRRRTYEELDELFNNNVPTRQFKKYETVAERRAAEAFQLEQKTVDYEHCEDV
ncbi:general alpha-glucoside permease [Trichomonascus vanleenenianus]|uniref:general alpha-glucoside permease n=1 Tax=Trichomonascus vanleenenianus TaxID=2268995 RepID=UPI003ECA8B1E